ncbi:MAG: hypothetical protein HC827_17915 [Cyanobacteria bacterium RM1_2_2]|nr:hypothetical protein [Cyanobacteria bacterium RM1_2_2]
MYSPENIQLGARVEILQPDYVADAIGIVVAREELADGQLTDRWLIQVIGEDVVLSLTIEEFRVID